MSVEAPQQTDISPASATQSTATTRPGINTAALRVMIGLLALAVVINAVFPLLLERTDASVVTPLEAQSAGVVLAAPVPAVEDPAQTDASQLLVATLDNRVLWLENGAIANEAQFDNLVGGLAISADGQQVYAGTSDGKVTVLDENLQIQREIPVTGRVVGLAAVPAGGFVVSYGSGAYSDRYWTSYYPPDSDQAAYVTRAEFTITAVDATEDGGAIFSTANSRVSLLDGSGTEQWKVTLTQPPTVLQFDASTGQTLVGDERGNLSLLAADGATQWAVHLSEYPIRSAATGEGFFFAADEHGDLFALDASTALHFAQQVTGGSIDALVQMGDELTLVPRNGMWQTIHPDAMSGAGLANTLRLAWYGVNAALLLALIIALIATIDRWRRNTVRTLRFAWRQRTAYVFVLPALLLILVFSYYPAITAFYYSLTDFSVRSVTEFVGLENYRRIFTQDFYFRVGFINLLIILVTGILKTLTVPLLVAELIFRLRNTVHQYVFRTLFVLPAVVPGLITVFLWRMVYDPYAGLLNQVLNVIGLSEWTQAWLGNESTALWAVVAAGFPYISAFPFLIYMGGLLNISTEMYDAAKIDGAGWWRQFWNIDVPLLIPQFRLLLFFTFAGAIQGFAQIFIFTRGGPGYATYVPGLQMYFQLAEGDFGYASAIGVVLFVMVFIGTIFILRFRQQTPDA